jgi:TPR repeat protein
VKRDLNAAAGWYRKAAEQGDAAAQYTLGLAYAAGMGVTEDRATALAWLNKSAAQGFQPARDALAKLAPEAKEKKR